MRLRGRIIDAAGGARVTRPRAARVRAEGDALAGERHELHDRARARSPGSARSTWRSLGCAITAMASEATRGNPRHFDARIAEWKPHPGRSAASEWIRDAPRVRPGAADPDARAPAGPLLDPLRAERDRRADRRGGARARRARDRAERRERQPARRRRDRRDPARRELLRRPPVLRARRAEERRWRASPTCSTARSRCLCRPETSEGLPAELISLEGAGSHAHHGFKGMQVTASALSAEALKLTMPAAAFSRSTESHNQDKVSMGSIAARDCAARPRPLRGGRGDRAAGGVPVRRPARRRRRAARAGGCTRRCASTCRCCAATGARTRTSRAWSSSCAARSLPLAAPPVP